MKITVLVPCTIEIDDKKYNEKEQKNQLRKILAEIAKPGYGSYSGWYSYKYKGTTVKNLKKLSGL
jgi:hypothetical protein